MFPQSGRTTVALSELRVGVILPADVADERNSKVLLLSKGIPITEEFLKKLQSRGIKRVSVDEESAAILRGERPARKRPISKPVDAKPKERPLDRLERPTTLLPSTTAAREAAEAKLEHSEQLRDLFESAKRNSTANGRLAKQVVAETVQHMMADIDVFLKVALQTTESSEVYEHCLAAAQLAMSVGLTEGLSEQAIQDLGVGCMMSRIGQSDAATHAAEQMKTLSAIELMDLKRTPCRTFDFLQNLNDISVGARSVAYQIFERFNGTGYPRGRVGNQITPLSRIASVCDVYVALTSPRPYRAAYEPYQAIEVLLQETRAGKFDPLAVRALLRTIGLFPIGSFAQLTDGSVGQVIRNHKEAYDRPVIHLYFDPSGDNIQLHNESIDLQAHPELGITAAISSELVQQLLFTSSSEETAFAEAKTADPEHRGLAPAPL